MKTTYLSLVEASKEEALLKKNFSLYSRLTRMVSYMRRNFAIQPIGSPDMGRCMAELLKLAESDGTDPRSDAGLLLREQLFQLITKGASFREIADILAIPEDAKKQFNKRRVARTLHNVLRKHYRHFFIEAGKAYPSS